jgi:hypothetical protein
VEREEARLSYRRTMWLLAWYYVNGARRFDQFDPSTGLIQPHVLDEDGNLEYQSQELLSAIDRTSARLASMDVRPKVNRIGTGMEAVRSRATGQLLGDSLASGDQVNTLHTKFANIFTTLGSCGVTGHIVDHPTIGLVSDYEIVHPTQMFPFPSLGQDATRVRGMLRQRVVPVSYLKEMFGDRKINANMEKMEWWEINAGETPADTDEYDIRRSGPFTYDARGAWSTKAPRAGTKWTTSDVNLGVAKIRELWLFGPRETVDRYAIVSGDYVMEDIDFEGLEIYCPIGWATFLESQTFHGLGLFDLLFPLARQMEWLLKSLFNNVRDADKYGIVVMPQGQFNERAMLRDVGQGLRALSYEPDPIVESFRPFVIQPFTLGDVPGKTAAFAKDLLNQMSPVQDLIQEKGRIDSAPGLAFLDEQISRAMTNPTRGVVQAWGAAHRSVIQGAARVLSKSPRDMTVPQLSLDLAGAVINVEQGTVSFSENPLPTIGQLSFTIREAHPRSEVARKQEALQLYQMEGLQDPDAFKLFAVAEGLDFAIYLEDYRAPYDSIVQDILVLFGDGQTPGEIVTTPHTSKPEVQMRILETFMTGPIMKMASPDVQDEFMKLREFLLESMGLVLPAAVPNPDDMALLTQGAAGGGQSPASLPFPGGGGGGGAPQLTGAIGG